MIKEKNTNWEKLNQELLEKYPGLKQTLEQIRASDIRQKKNKTRNDFDRMLKKNPALKKKECSKCGSAENLEAHHADYEKPFEIETLCRKCHKTLHRLNK